MMASLFSLLFTLMTATPLITIATPPPMPLITLIIGYAITLLRHYADIITRGVTV